ncbi:MAG TPA: PAC2 family protein [Nitrososphaeraceae archaeon]
MNNPVLIVGFLGTGMIGQLRTDYIVEQANLHQIYFIESEYIFPGAIILKKG